MPTVDAEFDLTDITSDELVAIGEVLGCETLAQVQAELTRIQKSGEVPLKLLNTMVYLAQKQAIPGLTVEAAGKMGLGALGISLGKTSFKTAPKKTRKRA